MKNVMNNISHRRIFSIKFLCHGDTTKHGNTTKEMSEQHNTMLTRNTNKILFCLYDTSVFCVFMCRRTIYYSLCMCSSVVVKTMLADIPFFYRDREFYNKIEDLLRISYILHKLIYNVNNILKDCLFFCTCTRKNHRLP